MPNDVPDWTQQHKANLYGSLSNVAQGDVSSQTLNPDSANEQIVGVANPQITMILASFKALTTFALVAAGPALVGNSTGVNPQYAQNTTAGNLGVACVTGSGSGAEPTTTAPGWVKVKSAAQNGGWAAIWAKPNLGGSEAPPQFTGGQAGLSVMMAQLTEYSGAVTSSPVDQTASAGGLTTSSTVTMPAADVAFGDLVVLCTHYANPGPGGSATFIDTFNNGATAVQDGSVNSDFNGNGRNSVFSHAIVPSAGTAQPVGVADWNYDATGTNLPGTGTAAGVLLAATAGKSYTCAQIAGSMVATTAAADRQTLAIIDGAANIFQLVLGFDNVIGHSAQHAESGLAYRGSKGTSMTVQWLGAGAGTAGSVNVGAYLR